MALTTKQRQELRSRAHKLKPVVMVGSQGVTEAVKKELERALQDHALIKVRIASNDRDWRRAQFAALANELQADLVQVIGSIGVLYRPSE